jgi:hypothetical protein
MGHAKLFQITMAVGFVFLNDTSSCQELPKPERCSEKFTAAVRIPVQDTGGRRLTWAIGFESTWVTEQMPSLEGSHLVSKAWPSAACCRPGGNTAACPTLGGPTRDRSDVNSKFPHRMSCCRTRLNCCCRKKHRARRFRVSEWLVSKARRGQGPLLLRQCPNEASIKDNSPAMRRLQQIALELFIPSLLLSSP